MKTQVVIGKYGKHPILSIHSDPANAKDLEEDKPIISFGVKKAEAILANLEEIKKVY